jgi:uncharacterized protein YerC
MEKSLPFPRFMCIFVIEIKTITKPLKTIKMAKKGNATNKVTTVAQASTVKINKATDALAKIVSELQGTNDSYEEIVTNIELKEAELQRLGQEFSEKEREMEADLKLKAKESASSLVNEILKSESKVSIDSTELTTLRKELETIKANFDKNVRAESEKAIAIVSARHAGELKAKDLEFAAASATMKAELSTASDQIASYTNQINDYKAQINADREARVQEAQARGGQSITVQSEGKR